MWRGVRLRCFINLVAYLFIHLFIIYFFYSVGPVGVAAAVWKRGVDGVAGL